MYPIIDHHCDLLTGLCRMEDRSVTDPALRCSIPQLLKGGIALQAMAVFTTTSPGSCESCRQQVEKFAELLNRYPDLLEKAQGLASFQETLPVTKTKLLLAIENASGICEEEDSLEKGFRTLDGIITKAGPLLYISLTWSGENRFGGGNGSTKGLTEEGKVLVEYLASKGIPLDFSHTSDALALELMTFIEQRSLKIPVLASHSNFRRVFDKERNLTDEVARFIISKKGVLGFNFVHYFLGTSVKSIYKHIEYALSELGAEDSLVFGADFFEVLPKKDEPPREVYFSNLGDASCTPTILFGLREELHLQEEIIQKIAYRNSLRFIKGIYPQLF